MSSVYSMSSPEQRAAKLAEQQAALAAWRAEQDWPAIHRGLIPAPVEVEVEGWPNVEVGKRHAVEVEVEVGPVEVEDVEMLVADGVNIPTGQCVRSAEWVTLMSRTDRLVDLLARDWFESKLALVPADVSIVSGDLAAALTRSLARTAVARARKLAHDWEALADEQSTAHAEYDPNHPRKRATFADEMAQSWVDEVNSAALPTPGQVIAASVDPMARYRWSDRLQARGTQLVQQIGGDQGTRPDVWDSDAFRYIARPDPIAHCAEERYELPQPCRYGQNGLQPASVTFHRPTWFGSSDEITAGTQPVEERLTTLILSSSRRAALLAKLGTLTVESFAKSRVGWRGHKLVSWQLAPRKVTARKASKARKVKQAKRAEQGATAAMGRMTTPWTCSARSLPRAADSLLTCWLAIETTLKHAEPGTAVVFPGGVTVTVVNARQVKDETRGKVYPVKEWARRAALAGITATA